MSFLNNFGDVIRFIDSSFDNTNLGNAAAQVVSAELEKYPADRLYWTASNKQGSKKSLAKVWWPLR